MNNQLLDDQDRLMSKARLVYRKIQSARAAIAATKANKDSIAQPGRVLEFQTTALRKLEGDYAALVAELVSTYCEAMKLDLSDAR